jgi:hypothetical protein
MYWGALGMGNRVRFEKTVAEVLEIIEKLKWV